jgi:hypothetical protein
MTVTSYAVLTRKYAGNKSMPHGELALPMVNEIRRAI